MRESKPSAAVFPVPPTRGALRKLIGLGAWAPGVTWLMSMMGTLMVVQRFMPSDRIEWLTRIYTSGQLKVIGTRVNYVVDPEIDPKRVYMFAQNHVNMIDHCTVYAGTSHFKQGVELAAHFELPFYGWFMKQRGTIPVFRDRRDAQQRLIESVRKEVERGHSILVFPEGTRTRNGRVGTFKSGLFRIAHALELPIVPVAVTGMFEVMRKGEPYIHPGLRVTVYLERPIETKGVPVSELPALIERVQQVVAKRVDAYYGIAEAPSEEITARAAETSARPQRRA